jgi:hypothetical protein
MMQITQSMEYEGQSHQQLSQRLKDFYKEHAFDTGIDWQFKYLWAKMTDEDAFAFTLKYPEYSERFQQI